MASMNSEASDGPALSRQSLYSLYTQKKDIHNSQFDRLSVLFRISFEVQVTCTYIT